MSYSIIPIEKFKKEAKRLIRKYPSLKSELQELNLLLSQDPKTGTSIGDGAYKIRLSIRSKGKGKKCGGQSYYISTDRK